MERKACFQITVNAQRSQGIPPVRRLKQSVLPFATNTPSTNQIRHRIAGGVCPSLAPGDAVSPETTERNIQRVAKPTNNNNAPIFCEGVLAKKDLTNIAVQEGIRYIILCTVVPPNQAFGCKQVRGLANVYSFFCRNCDGSKSSVR